jgi:hypothetical protein
MVKNNRLEFKVDNKTKERLIMKANSLGLNLTEFIEKIAREPISFIRIEFKKSCKVKDE